MELTAGSRRLAEAKVQKGIFQGDALSPLPFIIAMMLLKQPDKNLVNLGKDQSANAHGRHQTVCKKWKRSGNSNTHSENTESVYRDGIWHENCAMLVVKVANEIWRTEWKLHIKTKFQRSEKGNVQILGHLGS